MGVSLAQLLRDYRLKLGLTQEGLAEKVGVDRGYIAMLETGRRRNPSQETLAKLADSLKLSETEKEGFFLAFHETVQTAHIRRPKASSPVLDTLADFLALPPKSSLAPAKLREVFKRLTAILSERGITEQQKKETRWFSLLTDGYMYTPPEARGSHCRKKDASQRSLLPRSRKNELKMADSLRSLLEIFTDGRIHISRRVTLAEELLSLAKWRVQQAVPPTVPEKKSTPLVKEE
jgi:transcriptional regulator with XRE-family HTH domain